MSQNAKLLLYLECHDGITTLEAMHLGVCRLSERIRELERLQVPIDRQREKTVSGAHVTRYRLERFAYG